MPYAADILLDEIQKLQLSDPVIMDQRKDIDRDQQYLVVNGALLFKGRLVVPADNGLKLCILQSRHDHPTAGHQGVAKTQDLVCRDFDWLGMNKYVKTYVKECTACLCAKA